MSTHAETKQYEPILIRVERPERKKDAAQVVLIYFEPERSDELVAAMPPGITVAAFCDRFDAIDYLQFADEPPSLIAFDTYSAFFDGLLLCARLRELCPHARILPLGGTSDTTEALQQMGCLPVADDYDPDLTARFQAALEAPAPPQPNALVRALIGEARVVEANLRYARGYANEVLIYATTRERATHLRKEFSHYGPAYVAADLDELQHLNSQYEQCDSLFVASTEDAPLAEEITSIGNRDRVTVHIHRAPDVIVIPRD